MQNKAVLFILIAITLALAVLGMILFFKAPKIKEFNVVDWAAKSVQWKVQLLHKKISATETLNAQFQMREIEFLRDSVVKVFWESPDNITVMVVKGGKIVDRRSVNFTTKSIS